ncbi:hypothetical protein [Nocardia carnea]|uniref:hypothetical protein n=1 Tax=Nocardia carnea TaxID=37328 RepID=UPI0024574EB4|nr:hypothetical protein [Nocardia carnea]
MRRAQLHQLVTDLIKNTWTGDNADVAEAVLADDAFGALCHHLNETGDVEQAWADLVSGIDDNALDFVAGRADNPAAWLARRARDLPSNTPAVAEGA